MFWYLTCYLWCCFVPFRCIPGWVDGLVSSREELWKWKYHFIKIYIHHTIRNAIFVCIFFYLQYSKMLIVITSFMQKILFLSESTKTSCDVSCIHILNKVFFVYPITVTLLITDRFYIAPIIFSFLLLVWDYFLWVLSQFK